MFTFELTKEKNRFSIVVGRSYRDPKPDDPAPEEYPPSLARALEAQLERVWRDYRDEECVLHFPDFVVRAGHGWVDISTKLPTREVVRFYDCQKIEFVWVDREGNEAILSTLAGAGDPNEVKV